MLCQAKVHIRVVLYRVRVKICLPQLDPLSFHVEICKPNTQKFMRIHALLEFVRSKGKDVIVPFRH